MTHRRFEDGVVVERAGKQNEHERKARGINRHDARSGKKPPEENERKGRICRARDHDAELEPSAEGVHVDREPDGVQEGPERPRNREEGKPEQGRAGPEDVRRPPRHGADRILESVVVDLGPHPWVLRNPVLVREVEVPVVDRGDEVLVEVLPVALDFVRPVLVSAEREVVGHQEAQEENREEPLRTSGIGGDQAHVSASMYH